MRLLICAQVVDKNHPILGFFHAWLLEFSKYAGEIHVICLQRGEIDLPDNVFVYSLGKEEGVSKVIYMIRFYKYFVTVFFGKQITYVFFHMGAIYNLLAAPFFLIRRLRGVKFYWWKAHGHINRFGYFMSFLVDRVYTSTESGYPLKIKNRFVVGQAIDTDMYTVATIDKSNAKIKVLYAGRISRFKCLEIFLEVAKRLSETHDFTVVGPGTDEDYLNEIMQSMKLLPNVTYAGVKTPHELVGFYQEHDVFLNPSITNSMDKTVLEAILCGCIPVTANIAFKELLNPHGLFLKDNTATQFTAVVEKLSVVDRDSINNKLRIRVQKEHALNTFSSRLFSHG